MATAVILKSDTRCFPIMMILRSVCYFILTSTLRDNYELILQYLLYKGQNNVAH